MGVLRLASGTDYSDTDASISAIGTAGDVAKRYNLEVDCFRDMADWSLLSIGEVGSLAGVDRMSFAVYRDGSDSFILYLNNTSADAQVDFDLTDLPSAGTFVVVYGHAGATDGCEVRLCETDGTAIGTETQADWSTSIGASASGNGFVRVGAGVDNPNSTTSIQGDVDSVAVWEDANPGLANAHTVPPTGDTGIAHLCWYAENSGTTADDSTSNSDQTVSGATLVSGGSENAPSRTRSTPKARRSRGRARMRRSSSARSSTRKRAPTHGRGRTPR